jgi:hypothetical protein
MEISFHLVHCRLKPPLPLSPSQITRCSLLLALHKTAALACMIQSKLNHIARHPTHQINVLHPARKTGF